MNCCSEENKQTMSFNITNSGGEAKTFRLFGGGTGLSDVDSNTAPVFDSGVGFDSTVFASAVQSDGKILFGGPFTSYKGVSAGSIVRLNTDGSIDSTFVSGTGFTGGSFVYAIVVQSDGKILVGGDFTSYNGTSCSGIIRLTSTGAVDASFVYGTGFVLTTYVYSIAVQSNGSIIVGGGFTSYNGTAAANIIRLNSLGAVDGSFVYGTGLNGDVRIVTVQADGNILIGGGFTTYNGTAASRIVRLTTLGAVDGGFVYGTGFNTGTVYSIVIQSDGNILVGGLFASYNGTAASKIIRLSSTGGVDNTFVYGTGFSGSLVYYIKIDANDKIIIGGDFNSYNGTSANYIIRLESDGSIDSSFDYGTGFNSYVTTVGLNSSDEVTYIAGDFTTYNGEAQGYIVGVSNEGSSEMEPVTIVVNGGASTLAEVNNDVISNPICICNMNIVGSAKNVFSSPLRKNFTGATGTIDNTMVSLIAKFTAMQKDGINVVNLSSEDFSTCVLDGNNYLQWVVPAGENISIDLKYCQDSLLDKLMMLDPVKQVVKVKKYIHGRFKFLIN